MRSAAHKRFAIVSALYLSSSEINIALALGLSSRRRRWRWLRIRNDAYRRDDNGTLLGGHA